MADIFISYASADRERARTISERLSGLGHSVDRKVHDAEHEDDQT